MQPFDVYPLYELEIVRGRGSWVYDASGRRYLDFYGGHAVISVGHSHPHYVERVGAQLGRLGFYSNSVQNPLLEELAERLGEQSGCADYRLFMVNSGGEAVDNALKIAAFHNGRSKVLALGKAFHGRTAAAMNVTDKEDIQCAVTRGFERVFLPLNDLAAAERELARGGVGAVIVEGIQGIGGVRICTPEYLRGLQALCRQYDALLILDEIQTGFGRTGRFFYFQHTGIEPDLITVAKGMGNGFPVGGVLVHPRIRGWHGMLGTTFGGNHLACSAVLAVLEILEEEQLVENARTLGAYLQERLIELAPDAEVRGQGLMIGLEFPFPVRELRKRLLFRHGVFVGSSYHPNVLRLLPPLNIGREEADFFLEKFALALSENPQPVE